MKPTQFRIALVAFLAILISSILFHLFFPHPSIDPVLQAHADKQFEQLESRLGHIWIIVLLVFGVGAAVIYGLFFFRAWAPFVAVGLSVILVLFDFFLVDAAVVSGPTSALSDLVAMSWGALLAMTFQSPLKKTFSSSVEPTQSTI